MRNRGKALVLIVLFIIALSLFMNKERQTEVTIMTYNIHNAIGLDNKKDYKRIGEIINYYTPDIAALQELDSMTTRSGKNNVLDNISKVTGKHGTFAKAIRFDGGAYGIGTLSNQLPIKVERIQLPGREEKRVLLITEYNDYIFANTHISLNEKDRLESLKIIIKKAEKSRKPFILAGDLNDIPGSETIKLLEKHFTVFSNIQDNTYPANAPNQCIDYIAVHKKYSRDVSLISAKVAEEPAASDHRPVLVQIRIKN